MKTAHLALALVAALPLTACQSNLEDFATPAQIERLSELDAAQAAAEAEADRVRDEIKALASMTFEQRKDLTAAQVEDARERFVALETEWRAADAAADAARSSTRSLEQEIVAKANPINALLPWVPPPYQGPVLALSSLGALLFPRVRSNVKKSVRSAADGAWLQAARALVASVTPLLHSNDQAEDVAEAAIKVAEKQGKPQLAASLKAAKAAANPPA